jgi:hypothetical protein
MLVEIIETALANSHEPFVTVSCQCRDRLEVVLRVVRMQPDRGVDLDGALDVRDRERLGGTYGVGADDDDALDARGVRAFEGVGDVDALLIA